MRMFAILCALFCAAALPPSVAAQDGVHSPQVQWVEVRVQRFVPRPADQVEAIDTFGPLQVIDGTHAVLVGATDWNTPAQFAAMMKAHPGITILEMIECPGTYDDRANLRLGRMIRAAGIATHVPSGGSVRSGGVELFLAGATRRIDDGAEFAVHSWEDSEGLEAGDYDASAPENAKYIAFYREMGLSEADARAFYAMTNSVPYESALWLNADDMRRWVPEYRAKRVPTETEPKLVYLDLGTLLH